MVSRAVTSAGEGARVPSTARERLAVLLAAQDERSSSVQLQARPPGDLHLEVEGIGRITLPVPAGQARRLRALGRPARFGRGEATLTDPAVRDTWEVPPELVRAEWTGGTTLDDALEAVREELGLPPHCRLTAVLHSLLVYEKGQFFLPHQDSEKDDAMVATLVVTLPTAHTGGELVVHHLGTATTYRGLKDRLSLVAFYADCRHEVRPVTSGRRITLTYDLLLHGDPAQRTADAATVSDAGRLLREHFTTPVGHRYRGTSGTPPHRLAFLLDHEYSERGLSWSRLKGTDADRAWLLRAAADVAGCQAVLALTEIKETWDAYDPDDDYRRSRRGRRRWADDDPDDEGDAQDDDTHYEVTDLLDSSLKLTWWTEPTGTTGTTGRTGTTGEDISLDLSDAEVCTATPSSDLQPYASEYEGYMGNYGNTLDRWYRRAAVVVWPRDLGFANRAEASPSWALNELSARSHDPDDARTAAATLAPFWDTAVRGGERPMNLLATALTAALAVDDPQTAALLLHPFAVEDLRPRHAASFAGLTERYGEQWTDVLLSTWFDTRRPWTANGPARDRWLTTLPDLSDALAATGPAGTSTAHRLLESAWIFVAATLTSAAASSSATHRRQHLAQLGPVLAAVLTPTATLPAADLHDTIIEHCRRHGDALTPCLLPALRAAPATPTGQGRTDPFARLAADQATHLQARLARPVRAEDDWSIRPPGGCTCELCTTLNAFLADPTRRTLDWPLAQNRRSHIHSRIDQADLPVTHQTRRHGSPYTLVLTKTANLFRREAQQRAQDQADLDWLLERWPPTPDDAPPRRR